jgi:hypothetical protein
VTGVRVDDLKTLPSEVSASFIHLGNLGCCLVDPSDPLCIHPNGSRSLNLQSTSQVLMECWNSMDDESPEWWVLNHSERVELIVTSIWSFRCGDACRDEGALRDNGDAAGQIAAGYCGSTRCGAESLSLPAAPTAGHSGYAECGEFELCALPARDPPGERPVACGS